MKIKNFIKLISISGSLNDLSCTTGDETTTRGSADLIVALDTNWRYEVIQPALASVQKPLEVFRC